MDFRILGPLEVYDGEHPLALRGRKQRALLALLLLHANEVVSGDRFLEELWGGEPSERGRAALRVRVSQLRKALGGDLVVTRAPGYLLRVELGELDADRFEMLLAEGTGASAAGDAEQAASTLREALALWRGPALADFAYEAFAQAEIARLDDLRLAALEERIEADLALGRHRELVGELEAVVAEQPFRERLRAQLMLALYRSGRQAEALSAYREARGALVEELGIEPGPSLQRLEQAILRQEAWLEPPAEPSLDEPAVAGDERKLVSVLVATPATAPEPGDPERERLRLERVQAEAAAAIEEAAGKLETVPGGSTVAVFGAPVAQEDHSERALHAALALSRRLPRALGDGAAQRVGVETGEAIVGASGEGSAGVTGSPVSRALRLAEAARPGEILVGERVVAAVRGAFEFGPPRTLEAGLPARPLERALALTRPHSRFRTAFVGRRRELDVLQATYRRTVEQRRSHLVTVVGEAGVGKTRLVQELWSWLARELPEPSRRTGRCLPYGRGITYRPLADVLREELGLLETDAPETVRERLGSREILGLTLGLDVAPGLHPLVVRERLHEAWAGFVEELVAERPAVVLVEDLHWAQEPLLELLERLVRDVRGPLLLLATARPEFLDGRPAWGSTGRDTGTLRLEPLSADDASSMLAELADPGLGEDLRRLLLARAEGNPFYLEELLASLSDGDARSEVSVPESVQAVLSARIDLLPPTEKAALQAASVIGRVFWRGPVRELLDGIVPDFALLEARDFIRRRSTSSLAEEREFAFKHALTREVAYASLPAGRRALLHAAFATWLERVGGGRDEHAAFLAHHYFEAARPEDADLTWEGRPDEAERMREDALAWLRRAGELATRRYELDEAIALFERALALKPAQAEECEVWRAVAYANALKHDGNAFWAAMERAIECSSERRVQADVYSELAFETCDRWGMWKRMPDLDVVDGWIERALALAEPGSAAYARALVARVWRDPRQEEAAREALAVAAGLDDTKLRSGALEAQRIVAFAAGDFERAVAWDERRIALLPALADPDARADVPLTAAPSYVASGRFPQARRIARRHDELARGLTPHHRVHGVALLLEVEECAGGWEAIRALEERTVEAIEANLDTPCIRNARSFLVCAVARAYLGEEGPAEALEQRATELGMKGFGPVLAAPRLRLALARDDKATAERLLAEMPASDEWFLRGRAMALQAVAARLDGLVALGCDVDVEKEAPLLLQPGTYLEPFALRALGLVRSHESLLRGALARFEKLGLDWHAAETRRLLASQPR